MSQPSANAESLESRPESLGLRRELRLADLILFNVIATLGPQLIPAFAHVGPVAIPLHIAAAALFFVPCVLVIASLSRRFPGEGGFYIWTKHAFGESHAFLCGWSWWLSVLLFLPTVLLIAVGVASEAAGRSGTALAASARWQIGVCLLVLWLTVAANIAGLRFTKWLSNVCCILLYSGVGLVLLGGIAVFLRFGSATGLHFKGIFTFDGMSLWAQIGFAYTGLELGSLLGGEICHPAKTIPRAAWISAAAVALGYIAGSVALMLVIPPASIDPISGLVQVASLAGSRLGFSSLGVITAAFIFFGLLGKISTWGAGAARLPVAIGIDGAMPQAFTRVHPKWGTPWAALLIQGVACSAFLLLTQAGETVRSGWQLLMDMEILVAFVPYIYIFLSAWRLGQRLSAAAGLLVTLVAILFSAVPPEKTASVPLFEFKLIAGSAFLLLLGWYSFAAKQRRRRKQNP